MPLRNVRGHEDFKRLVLTRVNQLDKPVVAEGSPSLVSRDELMSIKAQLIDLTFLHDVEYFLDKENLNYAEIWFFDGSETFDSFNNLQIFSQEKILFAGEIIGDFENNWDGWAVTNNGAISFGFTTSWAKRGNYSLFGAYQASGVEEISKDVDLTDYNTLKFSARMYTPLLSSPVIIDVLIDNTQVASFSSTVENAYEEITGSIDISSYTGTHTVTFRISMEKSNSEVYLDFIRLVKTVNGVLTKQLTTSPVSDVMVILKDEDAVKLGNTVNVFVRDGANTVEITQNKQLTTVNLSSLTVEIQLQPDEELDNFAILWR